MLAFYRFVRAADDVADSPDLPPEAKLARLRALERALRAGDPAEPLAEALHAVDRRFNAGIAEASLLLDAFRQDAVRQRYDTWEALLDYCRRSADPVGRFLLRLHGEGEAAHAPADALCTALQILNHLQDLARDRADLNRIYLPEPWLERAGGEAAFFDPARAETRRAVLDAALDRVDALLMTAGGLPERIESPRLATEAAVTLAMARRLSSRLRRHDPIRERVAVSGIDAAIALAGALIGLPNRRRNRDPEATRAVVAASGSSFRLGMACLDRERRRAIHAVYAFCRLIDDIADGAAPPEEKRAALGAWRREIDALPAGASTPIGRELARAMAAHDLPIAELHALLDGMEQDCADRVRIADDAAFDLYCRRVAGAVGVLSVRIFGASEAEDFALSLGRTLQIVNVLRDVDEDAALDRVYVPLSRLGGRDGPADALVATPRFVSVCADLAREAQDGFDRADAMLAGLDRRRLKPAILMMEGYRALLGDLRRRGFERRGARLRIGPAQKLRLVGLSLRAAP